MNFIIKKRVIPFFILTLISFFMYIFAPKQYDYTYCILCLGVYLLSFLMLLIYKKKKNYFDFETIFLFSCLFVYFAYPCFAYPVNPEMFFMFDFAFNHNVITRGTALALLGLECFILGSVLAIKKERHKENIHLLEIIKTRGIIIASTLFLIAFSISSYDFFLKGEYTGGISGIGIYFFLIYTSLLTISLVLEFRNLYIAKNHKISYKFSKLLVFITFFTILIFLYAGSRLFAIQIFCIFISCFSIYYKPLGIGKFLLLISLGALTMTFIAMTRSGMSISENNDFRGNNIILGATMDLIINARTLYVCVDYVDNHSIFYGKTMIVTFLSFIPFSQRVLLELNLLDIPHLSSGIFFTTLDFGEESSFGVGSNIIADIFLSFGTVGVIIFMWFLGYFQELCRNYFIDKNIKWILCYMSLIGYVLYMSRGEYFFSVKAIFWTNFLFLIIYSIRKNFRNEKKII